MKKQIKLHIAAQKVVEQFGKEIICTDKFANLLMDYHAFEEYPATKQIIRDILKQGYGQRIYEEFVAHSDTVVANTANLMNEYCHDTSFKQDQVSYVFDCILYALGKLTEVNDPFSNAFNPYAQKGNILDTLDEQYNLLKKQYLDLLDKLIVNPKDLLSDPAGYYTTESLTTLYGVESKLLVLQAALGKTEQDWCKNQLAERRTKMQREKVDAVKTEIVSQQNEFLTLLAAALVVPKHALIRFSGTIENSREAELKEVEDRIKALYAEIGLKYDDWCNTERNKLLAKYQVGFVSLMRQIILKIVAPIFVTFFSILTLVRFVESKPEIEELTMNIAFADSLEQSKNFLSAFDAYHTADTAYTGSFFPSHYHYEVEKSFAHAIVSFDKYCDELIEQRKFSEVKHLIDSIPSTYCEKYVSLDMSRTKHQKQLEEEAAKGLDQMLNLIQLRNGKLTKEDKDYLNELIAISNDSYWYNVIKKKSK